MNAYVAKTYEYAEIEAFLEAKGLPAIEATSFVIERDTERNIVGVLPVNVTCLAGPEIGERGGLLEALDRHIINTSAGYGSQYLVLEGGRIGYRKVPEKVGT